MDMGCSSVWITHSILGQKDIGCSSVWVAHVPLGQNNTKKTWVALQCRLLKLFGVKPLQKGYGLLFSVGCSCQNALLCKDTEPTLIAGLLGLLIGCSVTLQVDPKMLSKPANDIHLKFNNEL